MPSASHPPSSTDTDTVSSLTSALVDANDQLLALYTLTEVTADSLDGQTAVREILEQATRLLDADALTLQVHQDEGVSLQVTTGANRNAGPTRRSESQAPTSTTIDVSNVSGRDATLIARRSDRPFGTGDHKLLTAIANMALGAVHTGDLHREAVQQAIVSRDHDTASKLAIQALPQWEPTLSGVDFFAKSLPARAAGGDLYTYAEIDDSLHFVVGDVSGKGLPAAMMMTNVISASLAAFQAAGESGPADVLDQIDAWMYDYLSDAGLFTTLLAGCYHQRSAELRLANAGHSPVLWFSGGQVTTIEAAVPPIGVLPVDLRCPVAEVSLQVSHGDRLVVASDGFTEQEDPSGEMFGEDRLVRFVLQADGGRTSNQLGAALFDTIDAHAAGTEQGDDRTLLAMRFEP